MFGERYDCKALAVAVYATRKYHDIARRRTGWHRDIYGRGRPSRRRPRRAIELDRAAPLSRSRVCPCDSARSSDHQKLGKGL